MPAKVVQVSFPMDCHATSIRRARAHWTNVHTGAPQVVMRPAPKLFRPP